MRARCFALWIAWTAGTAACRDPGPQPPIAASAAPSAPAVAPRAGTPPEGMIGATAVPPAAPSPFEPERVTGEAKAMGTHLAYAAYTTRAVDAGGVHRAFERATAEILRIEALMTTWRPDSDLSRVNDAAPNVPTKVAPETFDVVAESLHTSAISEGTFDITFETLHGLWKFDEDLDPHPPDAARIKAKLPLLGYKHVKLDPAARTIALDTAGTKISLGGIAKGYAVDRAAKVLADAGVESFYVQAGGDLYARGKKPDGNDWSAGVRDPRGPEGSYFALLPLADHAFSTAGDYERSYVTGGKRYHHIIDPRTGWPATASRSVTIWAPTAFLADAIDDAVFILGPKKGLALVESLDGVGAIIVDAKNNLWISKRLEGKLRVVKAPTEGL